MAVNLLVKLVSFIRPFCAVWHLNSALSESIKSCWNDKTCFINALLISAQLSDGSTRAPRSAPQTTRACKNVVKHEVVKLRTENTFSDLEKCFISECPGLCFSPFCGGVLHFIKKYQTKEENAEIYINYGRQAASVFFVCYFSAGFCTLAAYAALDISVEHETDFNAVKL